MFNTFKFKLIDFYTKTHVVNYYKKCLKDEWLPRDELLTFNLRN